MLNLHTLKTEVFAPKTWRIRTQNLLNQHCDLKLQILHFKRWKEKNLTQNVIYKSIISIFNIQKWRICTPTNTAFWKCTFSNFSVQKWIICNQNKFNWHCYLKLQGLHFRRWKVQNLHPKSYLKVQNFNLKHWKVKNLQVNPHLL